MPDAGTLQFDSRVAPHLPTLYRVACRLERNSSDAEDLVQDTCLAACEHAADLDAVDHPLRWLLRVLHNRFLDGARRRRRSPLVVTREPEDGHRMSSNDPGPEELLHQEDAERCLERAFMQLDDTQRTLLALRMEGYDLAEIAAITGLDREVLRARLHRARRSLARRLDEQDGNASRTSGVGGES
jgi:RNA polymerase sigma-70 factor (ECF subfamily)